MALQLPDSDAPPQGPPQPTPQEQMEMQKQQLMIQKDTAELEGKQLVNAQREYDLNKMLTQEELTEAVKKDVMQALEQAARTPYMGGQ